jgi:hypothetical protein
MGLEQGKYYDLDIISSDVWARLATPIQVSALCTALTNEYEGEPEIITADVLSLLSKFHEQKLIDHCSLVDRSS